jgi:hypothetical protein
MESLHGNLRRFKTSAEHVFGQVTYLDSLKIVRGRKL